MNSFGTRTDIRVGGEAVEIYSLPALEKAGFDGVSRLPYSLKILLENLLRREDDAFVKADAAAMNAAIQDGHCGLLPEAIVPALARAQVARDRTMARALVDASRRTGLPVVLLAGNGHVRADIGVPRHLAEFDPGASVLSIGFGEDPAPPAGRFDRVFSAPAIARPDPCQALREKFERHRG